jgi:hypothetical protein
MCMALGHAHPAQQARLLHLASWPSEQQPITTTSTIAKQVNTLQDAFHVVTMLVTMLESLKSMPMRAH